MMDQRIETTLPAQRSGVWVCGEDGTCCYAWVVLRRDDVESFIEDDLSRVTDPIERARHAVEITGWEAHYSGPGRSFSDPPVYKVYGKKVLVTQRCGIDV